MRRRPFLGLAAAVGNGLAGCVGAADTVGEPTETGDAGRPGGDVELPVPRDALERGAPRDAIPAIVDPVFDEDWSGVALEARTEFGVREITPRLRDGEVVLGVERAGQARAYPLRLLAHHEAVNDHLGGPLLVTYCPLCHSGVSAVRRVDGEPAIFGVSGLLYRDDLVMYDRATGSLWSQLLATAIRGERTGDRLALLPTTMTSWGEWRTAHRETVVLRPPPESGTVVKRTTLRDYTVNPYAGYDDLARTGTPGHGRLEPKTEVVGVAHGEVARAYPRPALEHEGVVEDVVDGLPVVATVGADGTLAAYVRTVDGGPRRFEPAGATHLRAAGSRWHRTTGAAVDGPHRGRSLERANQVTPLFWFAWLQFHPDSELYG